MKNSQSDCGLFGSKNNFFLSKVIKNKTRTSKVGAISKARKAQNIFFGKKLEIFENFSLSKIVAQCRKKIKRGDPLVSAGFVGYVKKVKNERRDPLETEKISKSRTLPKKIERGDSLVPSGFVGYLEKKVKNERGTLCTKFALAGLGALSGLRIVSKKWTDQCEDCSLKKEKGHCYSRAFFLERKTRRLKTLRPIWKIEVFNEQTGIF